MAVPNKEAGSEENQGNAGGDVMEIIYLWEVPKNFPNISGYDDIPEAYRVVREEKANSGILVEARYNGKWHTNPWSMRPVVRHLLEKLELM